MKIIKSGVLFLFFFLLFQGINSEAQVTKAKCEVKVETKVTNPEVGKKNGKIELTFPDTGKKHKVFLINKGEETAKKEQGNTISNLGKGFYDLIITDDKGCSSQITLTLN